MTNLSEKVSFRPYTSMILFFQLFLRLHVVNGQPYASSCCVLCVSDQIYRLACWAIVVAVLNKHTQTHVERNSVNHHSDSSHALCACNLLRQPRSKSHAREWICICAVYLCIAYLSARLCWVIGCDLNMTSIFACIARWSGSCGNVYAPVWMGQVWLNMPHFTLMGASISRLHARTHTHTHLSVCGSALWVGVCREGSWKCVHDACDRLDRF